MNQEDKFRANRHDFLGLMAAHMEMLESTMRGTKSARDFRLHAGILNRSLVGLPDPSLIGSAVTKLHSVSVAVENRLFARQGFFGQAPGAKTIADELYVRMGVKGSTSRGLLGIH